MECQRSDTYEVLSLKAADKTDIPYQKGYCVLLFKVMGSLIKDEDITIKGVKKSWTLGRYLQLIKKSPNNLKIGVAIEPRDSDESCKSHLSMVRPQYSAGIIYGIIYNYHFNKF